MSHNLVLSNYLFPQPLHTVIGNKERTRFHNQLQWEVTWKLRQWELPFLYAIHQLDLRYIPTNQETLS